MASRFPGGFGLPFAPFQHAAFQHGHMHPFPQQELTITDALQFSSLDWHIIRQRLGDVNSALNKLLGKSTEKPTLEKIISLWTDEKIAVLSEQEIQVLAMFLRTLDRLEKVKNAFPVGILLKERSDVNAILSKTSVHSVVHEDIVEAVKKGVTISSRFRATISVIPRVLDCLCPLAGLPTERKPESKKKADEEPARPSSPRPKGQQSDTQRRFSWENLFREAPSKANQRQGRNDNDQDEANQPDGFRADEGAGMPFADELLSSNPDFEFHLMMSVDEWLNMQRRERFQLVYEKKCEETNKLKKEKAELLQKIREKDKEIEDLKKQKGTKSNGQSGDGEDKKPASEMPREDQMESILKRLERLEAVCDKMKP